ncbi:MAG: gamma-glutamyltransferase [candidate division Zixibacteria bacterium]|nr:gamma-glutamyltransferase [candidate division Zixibacteria bacterium]
MNKKLNSNQRCNVLMALVFLLVISLISCNGLIVSHYYEHGVLATASPIATGVGTEVFREGGNAFDVAVAVGFALAVTHPEAGNIGGGGFAIIRLGESNQVLALDFRETAPGEASEEMYLDDSGAVLQKSYLDDSGEVKRNLSTTGALACGVPGTVAGLHELWEQHGSLPWKYLVGFATSLADSGFVVDEYLAESLTEYRQSLSLFEETASLFYPSGLNVKSGQKLVQKDLAGTLSLIAMQGRDGFYRGQVADTIVACMQRHGGLITAKDLESYQPIWRTPIHFKFDSLEVYSMPPPSSGGIVLGQILKLLEPYDLAPYTPQSTEFVHLFCEMSRLAFADRSEHLGDPDYYHVPVGLLDSAYLKRRRSTVKTNHAGSSESTGPGSPRTESEQTTHYSICDAQGNMVAITYTLNSSYGSKLVVGGAGFLLNNEMDDFSVKPGVPNLYGLVGGEANKIEPGKRMLSSMTPTLILQNDRPFAVLGSPGGSKIITTVAQAIVNFTRFDLSLKETVSAPRFHHQWLPDKVYLEEGSFDINLLQGLIRYGHNIKERSHYGDLQAVYITPDGLMTAASDPRKRGSSGGF